MKKARIKFIDFVTEGCSTLRFTSDDLHDFDLFEIVRNYSYYEPHKTFYEKFKAKKGMFCILKKSANVIERWLDINEPMKPFDHLLKWCDITHVDLIFEDDSNCYIALPWEGTSDDNYSNSLQRNLVMQNGDMIIEVRESENAESIFDDKWNIKLLEERGERDESG